jgi:4-amino-4-deoxy-L-arabinose transferase-like glycosyltransferase
MPHVTLKLRLIALLLLGLTLRLLWLWALWDTPFRSDEAEYLQIAHALHDGGYVDDGRWLRPPLFPAWLALMLSGGEHVLLVRLGQVALGTLLIWLLYRVTLAAWHDERSALLCAGMAAVYLPLIGYSNYLMAEMFLLVLLSGLLLMLLRLARQPSLGSACLAGVLLGLAMLTKPVAIACIPAVLAAVWLGSRHWLQRMQWGGIALLCAVATVAPWTIRNWQVHHRFIPLDTTAGFNFWLGNLPAEQQAALTMLESNIQEAYPNLADRNAAYMEFARQNALQYPGATLRTLAEKARLFWRLEADALVMGQDADVTLACPRNLAVRKAIIEGEDFGKVRPACWWQWLSLTADMVYLPLLLGLLVTLLWVGRHPLKLIGWFWVVPLYGVTILTVVQPRLRLPLLPVLLPCAAVGLVKLLLLVQHHISNTSGKRLIDFRWKPLLQRWRCLTGLLGFLVGVWVLHIVPLAGSQVWSMRGWHAWQRGNPQQAWQDYQTAVWWYPTRTDILVQAGQVAEALSYDTEALELYHRAINVVYYQAHARIGAARVLLRKGDPDGARQIIHGTALSQGQIERISFATPILPAKNSIDIGDSSIAEYGYVLGLYPPDSAQMEPTRRWSGKWAGVRFGTLPTTESLVGVRLSTNRPAGAAVPQVKIGMNGEHFTTIALSPGWWRTYRFVVPASKQGVKLTFESDTVDVGAISLHDQSGRELGIALDKFFLTPADVVDKEN